MNIAENKYFDVSLSRDMHQSLYSCTSGDQAMFETKNRTWRDSRFNNLIPIVMLQ
jgi:hypothetical protein